MAQLAKSRSVASYKRPERNESVLNPDFLFRLEIMGPEASQKLLSDARKIHSFDVCSVVQKIEDFSQDLQVKRVTICKQYEQLEAQKDDLLVDGKAKLSKLLLEKERYMDDKRNLEFELILLDERNLRAVKREEDRLEDMRHKIEVAKLQQDKIKK